MYWLGPWEEDLEARECRDAVARINGALTSVRSRPLRVLAFRTEDDDSEQSASGARHTYDAPASVLKVQRRHLSFYPQGWWLYRLACRVRNAPDSAGYDPEAALFCVANVAESAGPGALEKITLIDWTSSPIHRLNDALALDLDHVDDEAVREYLVFFSSFVGAEARAAGERGMQPFALPPDFEALLWDEDLDMLEDVAERESLQLFPTPAVTDDPDPFDVPEAATATAKGKDEPSTQGDRAADTGPYSSREKRQAVMQAFLTVPTNPAIIPSSAHRSEGTDGKQPRLRFNAIVWYRSALFSATFSVFKNGLVQMDDDQPLAGGQILPVPRWESRALPSGIWVLFHQVFRTTRQNTEIVKDLDSSAKAPELAFRLCRIEGDLKLTLTLSGRVRFEDVDFTGDVTLDECLFERSLEFRRCRFLRSLSLKNATVKGSFVLEDCRIEGALPAGPLTRATSQNRPGPTLGIDGLNVGRDLRADRLVVHGMVSGQSMRVAGSLQATGLRATLRRPVYEAPTQLDFSHSRIDGRFDLSAQSDDRSEPGARVRTRLDGDLRLEGLVANAVTLSGAFVKGDVILSQASCAGTMQLDATWLAPFARFGSAAQAWRTRITGSLHLQRASARLLNLDGCLIGRDLYLIDTVVFTSMYAELDGGFRCRIEGQLNASGAAVSGGLELDGVIIAGELIMITGRCGRLRAGCGIWLESGQPGRYEPRFAPARIGGMFLDSVTVSADVSLTAVQVLESGGYAAGGILARGVRLSGGFRLWGEDVEAILVRRANGMMHDSGLSGARLESGHKSIADLRSHITGDLDLRGIRASSTIDLSRATIDGRIRLGNVQIEGDLRAAVEGRTSCSAFEASIAKITGDVDLKALDVSGGLVARGLETRGSFFLTAPAKHDGTEFCRSVEDDWPAATCGGSIQLEAITASKLWLTARNVVGPARMQRDRPVISLARARLGQLGIGGFAGGWRQRGHFPVTIDLSRIEVGDWLIDPRRHVQPLLESTVPFDRNVFVALEERLAKLGYRGAAHTTWRRMIWRDARENRWRLPRVALNGLFSRQGTWPYLMGAWLLLTMMLVALVLADVRNIEDTSTDAASQATWSTPKAIALAFGYAVPPYGGSRFGSSVRARLSGPTCTGGAGRLMALLGTPSGQEPSRWCQNDGELAMGSWHPSPHDLAQGMSILQFFLWFLVAANLPSIIRRRG